MTREATITRKTNETDISLTLSIDGRGKTLIDTGIPFLDHMLQLFSAHGFFDTDLKANGDTEVDDHHTVEDIGICLGSALKEALGDRKGIKRYGEATIPMDEALCRIVLDLSNRAFLGYRVSFQQARAGRFDLILVKEFFRSIVNHSGMTLHIDLIAGDEPHHCAESIFKAFGRALDQATTLDDRLQGRVPSTKGSL
jgi:imidazoleglycerol-phosphate dehydratase